jgi:molybdopterin-guanine dinucleotide biosynthesis protein A
MTAAGLNKIDAACLILAGGKGKRLTPDKPLLEIDGVPIIERTVKVASSLFKEVIIVTNTPEKYEFLGLKLVPDQRKGCGPLMGIYSGLCEAKYDTVFACAADMPFLDQEMIRAQFREMDGYDIVVPYPRDKPEFLHAFYRKNCLPLMRQALDADRFKVGLLKEGCKTLRLKQDWFARHGLSERMELAFANINTMQDYRKWHDPRTHKYRPPCSVASWSPSRPRCCKRSAETLIRAGDRLSGARMAGNPMQQPVGPQFQRSGRIARHILRKAEGLAPGARLFSRACCTTPANSPKAAITKTTCRKSATP